MPKENKMKRVPYHELTTGSLLVASPNCTDSEYEKKVVLICLKDETKTLGICLNVPHSASFDQIFLGTKAPSNPNIALIDGGPDDQDHIMILHSPIDDTQLPSWAINNRTFLLLEQEDISPLLFHPKNPHILVAIGYFHWDPGALEEEIYAGQWLLSDSSQINLFQPPSLKLWNCMMATIGGKFADFAFMPEHTLAN
jgi:putative AlgH/UPF0301 family transcriptional regulator